MSWGLPTDILGSWSPFLTACPVKQIPPLLLPRYGRNAWPRRPPTAAFLYLLVCACAAASCLTLCPPLHAQSTGGEGVSVASWSLNGIAAIEITVRLTTTGQCGGGVRSRRASASTVPSRSH